MWDNRQEMHTRGDENTGGSTPMRRRDPSCGTIVSKDQAFQMDITGVYRKDPMKRQIADAVRIKRSKNAGMNNKNEWPLIKIPRAVIMT